MICDRLENLGSYFQPGHPLREAVELAAKFDTSLPDGRHPIHGDRLYASVSRYETEPAAQRPFESHRKYIDVQVVLEGEESIGIAAAKDLEVSQSYDPSRDLALYRAPAQRTVLVMRPGWFAVFFPHDAHQPNCDLARKTRVRKLVMKVAG